MTTTRPQLSAEKAKSSEIYKNRIDKQSSKMGLWKICFKKRYGKLYQGRIRKK